MHLRECKLSCWFIFTTYPFLLAPSIMFWIALLWDFGVSGRCDSAGTGMFSVDMLSVACHKNINNPLIQWALILPTNIYCHRNSNSHSLLGLLRIVCLITSLLGTPCSKRLDRSSRNHSPVTTFSSLQTYRPPRIRQTPHIVIAHKYIVYLLWLHVDFSFRLHV